MVPWGAAPALNLSLTDLFIFSILQISIIAQERTSDTATSMTHRVAASWANLGARLREHHVHQRGSKAFGRHHRDLQNQLGK